MSSVFSVIFTTRAIKMGIFYLLQHLSLTDFVDTFEIDSVDKPLKIIYQYVYIVFRLGWTFVFLHLTLATINSAAPLFVKILKGLQKFPQKTEVGTIREQEFRASFLSVGFRGFYSRSVVFCYLSCSSFSNVVNVWYRSVITYNCEVFSRLNVWWRIGLRHQSANILYIKISQIVVFSLNTFPIILPKWRKMK